MMKIALYPAGLLISVGFLAAALTGCLFSNSSKDSGAPGEAVQTTPYTVKGNTITIPSRVYEDAYCNGDSLIAEDDTIGVYTVEFLITGSNLTVFVETDTTASGAIVRHSVVFNREGSGSGLEGLWLSAGRQYTLLSGTLTESEKQRYDNDVQENNSSMTYSKSWVGFSGGTLTSYASTDQAARFIREWNDSTRGVLSDSAMHAIEVKAIDRSTVELKGLKTGEIVRITRNEHGDEKFTSSHPEHPAHQYYSNPKACPNDWEPQWYREFMVANQSTGIDPE